MCGLFGKIATSKKDLEREKLNVLGVMNDTRGGDSAGIFIDGDVEYGVDKEKLYYNFMKKSKLLKNTEKAKIVLGHTRKASVGAVTLENAQPVVIYNQDNEIDFVMIHNGTIFNYKELAEKHIPEEDIKDLTDSQVLARIFFLKGYDVLEEYEGAAAFITVDYSASRDNPKIFMFKGASSKYKSHVKMEEERPLYLTIKDDELWFSSIGEMLGAINEYSETLVLTPNILIEVSLKDKKIKLLAEQEVDRSKVFQYKSVYQYNNEYGQTYPGYNYNKKSAFKEEKKEKPLLEESKKKPSTLWIDDNEAVPERVTLNSSGLYFMNERLAHGRLSLSDYGINTSQAWANHLESKQYIFYQGRLLPNIRVWNMLNQVAHELKLTPERFAEEYPECINLYSFIPEINVISEDPTLVEVFERDDFDTAVIYDGVIKIPFSHDSFNFSVTEGVITGKAYRNTVQDGPLDFFKQFQEEWSEDRVDYSFEISRMRNHIYYNGQYQEQ